MSEVPKAAPDLLGRVRQIAEREVAPAADEGERSATFPITTIRRLADEGLVAAGLGLSWSDSAVCGSPYPAWNIEKSTFYDALAELSGAWLAVAESIHLQVLTTIALLHHGSDELRDRFLAPMAAFELIGANCFSEPECGSDLAGLTMSARVEGDDYVLDGTKTWVGHGTVAHVLNVYCRTGDQGALGITCLFVDASTPGITVSKVHDKMGVRALPNATLQFDGVRVPRQRVLGRPGRGLQIGLQVLQQGRLGLAACANGLSRAAMVAAVDHAHRRHQFGRPIIDFQGVGFPLADMANQLMASEALLGRALGSVGQSQGDVLAAHAKLFATDVAMRVTVSALQVLGAAGYESGSRVERYLREAKLLQIIGGTNEIQRVIISSQLAVGR